MRGDGKPGTWLARIPIFNLYQLALGDVWGKLSKRLRFPDTWLRGGFSKTRSLKAGHPISQDVMRQAFLRN